MKPGNRVSGIRKSAPGTIRLRTLSSPTTLTAAPNTTNHLGSELAEVFRKEDPLDALNEFVRAFGQFWTRDRVIIRRLHGMITLDAEMAKADAARQERRRKGLRVIIERLSEKHELTAAFKLDEVIDIAHALTSFETFDALAGRTRSPQEVVPTVQKLILEVLGLRGLEGKGSEA